MANISNITVFDGAATPVSHTFIAESVTRVTPTKITATWRESTSSGPIVSQPRLSITLEKLKSGIYRSERRLEQPILEQATSGGVDGYYAPPKVAHVLTDVRYAFYHERSTELQRRLVRQMGTNIDNGVNTSVASVTTGPVAELFDQLIMPT